MVQKNRKVIGILGIPSVDDENDSVIALYKSYKDAIVKRGCIPFLINPVSDIDYLNRKREDIPPLSEEEKIFYQDMVDMCDGIILQGGYRIYNYFEYIVSYSIEKDIPILGICMGMQLLARLDNVENCIEINNTNVNHKVKGQQYAHMVNILKDSLLYSIFNKDVISVNSKHNYHVSMVNNYKISAYSEDRLIEAIEYPGKKFIIGVQWHPEKMIEYDALANKLFDYFISKC